MTRAAQAQVIGSVEMQLRHRIVELEQRLARRTERYHKIPTKTVYVGVAGNVEPLLEYLGIGSTDWRLVENHPQPIALLRAMGVLR